MAHDMDGACRRVAELREQVAALKGQYVAIREQLGDLAGRVADTEDEVARVHEEIADEGVSVVAEQAGEHALRARRFAEYERGMQERMSSTDQDPASSA